MRIPRTAGSDAARVRLIASTPRLAALEWECDDTAPLAKMFEDSMDLDHAQDLLDEALNAYILAATAG